MSRDRKLFIIGCLRMAAGESTFAEGVGRDRLVELATQYGRCENVTIEEVDTILQMSVLEALS